jgi:nucleoside-diphosphate-sugar epimerase
MRCGGEANASIALERPLPYPCGLTGRAPAPGHFAARERLMRILVTGGAGFVGSHIVDALLLRGHSVRVYDALDRQVHPTGRVPSYLSEKAEFIHGDVRDRARLASAIEGVDVVFHEAAYVGVGQSMYEIRRYVDGNSLGGATLLDILANDKHQVKKLIVASSMSIYGEGQYRCSDCGDVAPKLRTEAQMGQHDWELHCPFCNASVAGMPTAEDKPLEPTSIYAITKRCRCRSAARTAFRPSRCVTSTSTARGRRSRTHTRACSRSSRAA